MMSMTPSPTQIEAALQAMVPAAGQQAPDAALKAAGERFGAMMQNPRMAPPVHNDADTNMVSKLAASQDAELQKSVTDVMDLSSRADSMTVQQMTAATMKTALELASAQLDLEAKMGVVNSSKSSVETLMKNQ